MTQKIANPIVEAALGANDVESAMKVQDMIAADVGGRYERPLGDRWQNLGLLGSGGSFDLKLIEQVTNMQDAVLERLALKTWDARESVPYPTPLAAAEDLLGGLSDEEAAELVSVRFTESNGSPSKSKRLTAVFRDKGIGMTAESVCTTVFRLGGSNKEDAYYLQGAFGMGGALTYRNAEAVVLVTRKDPDLLLEGEEDEISVAVVEWQQGTKGQTALYLVDRPWEQPGDYTRVWSCAASEHPSFEPGTHVALVSYRVEGIYRGFESDEKSFPSILNTRLYRPVTPVLFTNETDRGRNTKIRGLERKLEQSAHDFPSDEETLIFKYAGETYHLPLRYTLFPTSGAGNRRSLIAHDHAVLFLSNGQVHHHWTIDDFRSKTQFAKLRSRILVVVETDDLPIALRTALFTPDRSSLVKADIALRLEHEVRAFVDGWDALREENAALIRAALDQTFGEGSAAIGQRIGRAILATGFSAGGGNGTTGGGNGNGSGKSGGGGGTTKPIELLQDPTYLRGPAHVIGEPGLTLSRTYSINGPDGFLGGRGQLQVFLEHPDLDAERDISVGPLRGGRVRVQIALPDSMEVGSYSIKLKVENWFKTSGGLGPTLEHVTTLEVAEDVPGKGSGGGGKTTTGSGTGGPKEGGHNVALRWTGLEEEGFSRKTVGVVDATPASVLAEADPGNYGELASLGDAPIPTIALNTEYSPLKKYMASRTKTLDTLDRPRERYAVGVGVALMLLEQKAKADREGDQPAMSEDAIAAAQEAAARAVLAVMPAFDELAKESGLES
ncbi:hypothetical protein ACFFGH_28440 [Lysobacter korlensis]|uniref:Uncharacterized protein n=1 Tax=Lysobacter korlensis TaxID=553636 RepID=A0ABV6RXS3_9GAMM